MIDESRFSQGMSTERYHPWYGNQLEGTPIKGAEGLVGNVSVIAILSPEGGMTYEQTEPVSGRHHRGLKGPVNEVGRMS